MVLGRCAYAYLLTAVKARRLVQALVGNPRNRRQHRRRRQIQGRLQGQSRQEVPPLDSTQGVGAARGAVLVALLATAVLVLAPFPVVLIYR